MEFKKCTIDGKSYGDAYDEFGNNIVVTEVKYFLFTSM
jgi:hypothetical protein